MLRLDAPPADQAATPVGRGVDGVRLHVLDDRRRLHGVGELVEIAVRSNPLPLGYVAASRLLAADDRAAVGFWLVWTRSAEALRRLVKRPAAPADATV